MPRKRRSREFEKNSNVIKMEELRSSNNANQQKAEKKSRKKEKRIKDAPPSSNSVSSKTGKLNKKKIIKMIIVAIVLVVFLNSGYKLMQAFFEGKSLNDKNTVLEAEKEELQNELKIVNTDEYIEKKAREKLDLVMPGELIFVLPEEE